MPTPAMQSSEEETFARFLNNDDAEDLRCHLEKVTYPEARLNRELAQACRDGKLGCVRVLLKHGASPNHSEQFQTMLEMAVINERGEIFFTLWRAGAKAEYDPNPNRVLKFMASLEGLEKLLGWLVTLDNVALNKPTARPLSHAENTVPDGDCGEGASAVDQVMPWARILQNDDADLLKAYSDTDRAWLLKGIPFERAQKITREDFSDLFEKCKYNGHGVWALVKRKFEKHIENADFEGIAKQLSGLPGLDSLEREACDQDGNSEEGVFSSAANSIMLLALLSGRMNILEELLRRRQFDVLPAAMLMILVARGIMRYRHRLPLQEGRDRLEQVVESMKDLTADALKRMAHVDNEGIMQAVQVRLKTYGGLSLLDLADRAECDKFLSLNCCQTVLVERWKGGEVPVTSSRECERLEYRQPRGNLCSRLISWGSPRFKFRCHSVMHVIFLICFSWVLARDFHFRPSVLEGICFFFVLTYMLETGRDAVLIVRERDLHFFLRQERYWIDGAALLATISGFICRLLIISKGSLSMSPQEEAHDFSLFQCRVLLLVGLLCFYIRLLPLLSSHPVLGPRLTMMRNMLLKDLLPLIGVFVVLLLSFGVVIQALLYPNGQSKNNTSPLPYNQLHYIFQRSFYGMFSPEYPLDDLKCDEKSDACPNETGGRLVLYAFHAVFVFAVNVTLINLLIALFSNTVNNIAVVSTTQWLAQRYQLVATYNRRSLLPPPLNVISCVVDLVRWPKSRGSAGTHKYNKGNGSNDREEKIILLQFLLIQAFALHGHRHELGSEKQRWESEISALRQEMLDLVAQQRATSAGK